jgi:hypothetical protein
MTIPAAPPELVSAVDYLYDIGELDVLTLIHFIEKPSHYPELLALWELERDRQVERQLERRAYSDV